MITTKVSFAAFDISFQGPVVQSSVCLTSLLMTNVVTVVAKVFSNTLIFLLQKCETTHILFSKNINVFVIF